MNIGEKIKQARKALGLTQPEVCRFYLSQPNLSDYENGKRQPGPEVLQNIVDAMDKAAREKYGDGAGARLKIEIFIHLPERAQNLGK